MAPKPPTPRDLRVDVLPIRSIFILPTLPCLPSELPLTGRATSERAQFRNELMADMTTPGNLAVRPIAPCFIREQLQYCGALVRSRAWMAVRGIGADSRKASRHAGHRHAPGSDLGKPRALGGGVASEAVGKDVGSPS